MKKIQTGLAALLLSACAVAQQNPTAMKYAKFISVEDAKKHLNIIASDAFEGRETAKPGGMMAAEYIAAEFKKLGLQGPVNGSYFQDVPLIETSFTVKSLTINGTSYAYKKDFYASSTAVVAGDNSFDTKEIIFLGHKPGGDVAAELGKTDITGKAIFLVNDGETPSNTTNRIAYLQTKKPLMIISTSAAVADNISKGRVARVGGPSLAITTKAPLAPVFSITADVANQLLVNSGETFETFKASGDDKGMQANQVIKADVAALITTTTNPAGRAVEVLGYMPGTDLKDQVLVFSAHYDHLGLTKSGADKVYNGADDDGSGTTGILEIARAFAQAKKEGHGPRRSILFLGNVGEEKGLLGSEYYTDHPIFPLKNTITDLNIDMIGRVGSEYVGKPDSANYVYAIGSGMLSVELRGISEAINKKYTNLILDYTYDNTTDKNRYYYRSDHYNFAKHGVPIIFYFNGVHADYHKATDEVSKINFPLLVKRAQLVFYTGWELANRAKKPQVDVF